MLIVIEQVLDRDEVAAMRELLDAAAWVDGAQTAGSRSVAVKQNLQLDRADPLAGELGNTILRKLGHNALFISASLAETIFPPMFNLYQNGGHYGTHVDSALMRMPDANRTIRSDLSATLFLSDPADYDGGELVIEDAYGGQGVKLAAGDMVLYPSSSLHQVTPVTRGQRIAAILWLQSAVADTQARSMLFDLDQSIQSLSVGRTKDDPDLDRLIHVYHNLLRRWATL
ncbi:Fe2+-dependent dioxygenase [Altererythrobacter soli]|uniref:Fe2+-dependent dioxygenase n=1 Tax=Croceibacterium soli TaxID=1739690 RepID=A0A6I4URM5_9SPHN|nr:Fe2+-dependent dioxygenase [Croceibacterium soli]MXP41630.1 Fe2+-dependent dioxygenase [Croceibacterium soli]